MKENAILKRQNDPELLRLLEASTVAYTKAKYGEIRITYFLIFLALAYPVVYVVIRSEPLKFFLFGCSFFLTILIQILTGFFTGNTSKGAIFKEAFDTDLFGLPWKSTLKKPSKTEISKYSRQYKGKEIKDWYSQKLSAAIPHNIAIAVLQYTNTSWDIDLRRHYRKFLIAFLIGYSLLVGIFLLSYKPDGITLFLVYFSILSFYTHFIALIRGHSAVIARRKAISTFLNDIIRPKKTIQMAELRDIQDEIYATRQESAKVPTFFFRWYQKRMNVAAEDYIEEINRIYG